MAAVKTKTKEPPRDAPAAISTRSVASIACLALFVLAHIHACFPSEAHPVFRLAFMAAFVATYVVTIKAPDAKSNPWKAAPTKNPLHEPGSDHV